MARMFKVVFVDDVGDACYALIEALDERHVRDMWQLRGEQPDGPFDRAFRLGATELASSMIIAIEEIDWWNDAASRGEFIRDFYELLFDDGVSTDVSTEHLIFDLLMALDVEYGGDATVVPVALFAAVRFHEANT